MTMNYCAKTAKAVNSVHEDAKFVVFLASLIVALLSGCSGGGGSDGSASDPSVKPVAPGSAGSVTVTPANASISTVQPQQFTATVQGSTSSSVTWKADGVEGGNAVAGLISTDGMYVPPTAEGVHTISATSVEAPSRTATVTVRVGFLSGVLTYHNDNARTGQNLQETVLTPANVKSATFGKLFSWPVDGFVYAQPLFVANVPIGGQLHNVVFVATEHNSVYAFDAAKQTGTPLWQARFIDPARGITTVPPADTATAPGYTGPGPVKPAGCEDLVPEIGITGTPVIDPASGTLYVVAMTKEKTGAIVSYQHRLHALDIKTGTARPGSGQIIQASVPGTTSPNDGNGRVLFQSLRHSQRAALLLNNNIISVAFGSLCDILPYQGWVLAFDSKTLQLVGTLNTVANDATGKAGVWHSGGGPAADAQGNVFVATGDGPFDPTPGQNSYGDSVLKLANGSLTVSDYFSPYNQASLADTDTDLGAGGPLLLPDQSSGPPHLMVVVGKEGVVYLLNRDNLGRNQPGSDNQIVQSFPGGVCGVGACSLRGTPAYFNNSVYTAAVSDRLKAYALVNGRLVGTGQSPNTFRWPGATPVISANGVTNAIVWALETNGSGATAVLHAYPAAAISTQLYNSNEILARDNPGPAIKYGIPTVANGRVYVASTSQVSVFGLLP